MAFRRRDPAAELPSFEEIGASLRLDNADLPALMRQLADRLRQELGEGMVSDNREGNWASGPRRRDPVTEITVRFGSAQTFRLQLTNGALEATLNDGAVRGEDGWVKHQSLSLPDWLAGVHQAAHELAQSRYAEIDTLQTAMLHGLSGLERPALAQIDAEVAPAALATGQDLELFFAGQLKELSLAKDEAGIQRVIAAVAALEEQWPRDAYGVGMHVSGNEGEPPFAVHIGLPGQPQFTLAYPESPTPVISMGGESVTLEEWVRGLKRALDASREPSLEPSLEP